MAYSWPNFQVGDPRGPNTVNRFAMGGTGRRGYANRFPNYRVYLTRPRLSNKAAWDPRHSYSKWKADQKIIDAVTSQSFNVTTTGTVQLINGIQTGDDYNNRDGRRIIVDGVSLRGDIFYASTTAAHPADMVRFMIVYDSQTNGAAPSITDILTTANADSHLNVNNLGRFEILWDITMTLPQVPASTTSPVRFPKIKKYVKVKRGTQYSGTGDTVASIASGALFWVAVGSQASGVNNTVAEMSIRTTFHG